MSIIVNICGPGRSGSTLLGSMLGNSPNAFHCGEVYAWFRPYRTHHFKIKCTCKEDPCPYWEKIKDYPESDFHKKAFERLGVDFVIDSSKEISWVVDNNRWAARNGIKVINLIIWKKLLDLVYSHWKRGRGMVSWRRNFLNWHRKFSDTRLPFVSVCYNELASDPSGKLKDICRVIGMEYSPGKEDFWNRPQHHLFGSLGIRKQLETGNFEGIRPPEEFSPEFKKNLEFLNEKITKDKEVQGIMERLEEREVSNIDYQACGETAKWMRRVYPPWYYLKKVQRVYKRHFPQVWIHEQ